MTRVGKGHYHSATVDVGGQCRKMSMGTARQHTANKARQVSGHFLHYHVNYSLCSCLNIFNVNFLLSVVYGGRDGSKEKRQTHVHKQVIQHYFLLINTTDSDRNVPNVLTRLEISACVKIP